MDKVQELKSINLDPRSTPRIKNAKIFEIRLKQFSIGIKIVKYDSLDRNLLIEMENYILLNGIHIKKGDIIVEKDIKNTKYINGIIRNGMTIFNGKHLQYLDRTLNQTGMIPCNFLSYTDFKLGHWDHIFNDNIIWLKPTTDFKFTETEIITSKYKIYCDAINMHFLQKLMISHLAVLLLKMDDNTLYFDKNLFDIYHFNLHKLYNVYHKSLFFSYVYDDGKEIKENYMWSSNYIDLICPDKNVNEIEP
jgi:hypothetical protein